MDLTPTVYTEDTVDMTMVLDFPTTRAFRDHTRAAFDVAVRGGAARVHRGEDELAIVRLSRLREALELAVPARLRVEVDGDAWSAWLDERPFISDGTSMDDAVTALAEELREYAAEYAEHWQTAANHRQHEALVLLVSLSDDEQLHRWLLAPPA